MDSQLKNHNYSGRHKDSNTHIHTYACAHTRTLVNDSDHSQLSNASCKCWVGGEEGRAPLSTAPSLSWTLQEFCITL